VGVRVGIGVGGRAVAVAVGTGVGGTRDWLGTGLFNGGGKVNVGNPTGGVGSVGLNTAVMVKSGVGKTIGVGADTNGKLQASAVKINNPAIKSGILVVCFLLPSLLTRSISMICYLTLST
jgi:hypothetical protein